MRRDFLGFGFEEEFTLNYFISYTSRQVGNEWEEGMSGWGFRFDIGNICYFPGVCARTLVDLQYADNDVLAPCDAFSDLYDMLPAGKVVSIRGTVVRPQVLGLFRLPGEASLRLVFSTKQFAYVSQTKCTATLFGVEVETNFATGFLPQPFFRTNYRVR